MTRDEFNLELEKLSDWAAENGFSNSHGILKLAKVEGERGNLGSLIAVFCMANITDPRALLWYEGMPEFEEMEVSAEEISLIERCRQLERRIYGEKFGHVFDAAKAAARLREAT